MKIIINMVLVNAVPVEVVFTIVTGVTIYFIYYNWSLIKNNVFALTLMLIKKQKFGK